MEAQQQPQHPQAQQEPLQPPPTTLMVNTALENIQTIIICILKFSYHHF